MIEDINKFVWENIKELRKKKNLTQEELGDSIWLKRTRIIQIEKWTQSSTLNTLNIIADWLWVDIIEFFKKEG